MKISFQTIETPEVEKQKTDRYSEANKTQHAATRAVSFTQDRSRNNWMVGGEKKGKTMSELQTEAENSNVDIMQDYKTLLSNTMSSEDYAKLEEEGFDFQSMDPEDAVTIVDKIKAELVRSGKQIAGYTDDLDMDTLAAAVGSTVLAQAIADSFQRENIPLTEDNIEQVSQAWEMTASLKQPTDAQYSYMVENKMEPEIWDYYLAQNSGASQGAGHPRYYAENVQGYYVENASEDKQEILQDEVDKALLREGITPDEENRQRANQLLNAGIPLRKENLDRLERLQEVEFPVSEETFAKATSVSLAEGKEAIHADLTKEESFYTKAVETYEFYKEKYVLSLSDQGQENLAARRQLEEIRLRMTAEVNVKLLKSGFSIDTAPMEELVEALRQAEKDVAEQYFPDDAQAVDKYRLYRATNQTVEEIPALPAQMLGNYPILNQVTLEEFHTKGTALLSELEKANESYEALMTAPRKDLGDSIRKAFANVDDILRDMELPLTEQNRKAVRILGYNRMEMTQDNVSRIVTAEEQVERIVNKMTPASTLKMIRDGMNPLTSSFEELEQYFDAQPQEYEQEAERYSKYLYTLEKNQEITQEEKESFIGIYRLLHQIEASDGAVLGALVNSNAEIHFANLLSAVRSGKFKTLDVTVSDDFGTTVELVRQGKSISEQIAKGFEEDYNRTQLEQIRKAAMVEEEAVALLNRAQLPQSAEHLLAAEELMNPSGNFYKDWVKKKERYKDSEDSLEEIWEHLDEKETFQSSYEDMLEEMQNETEEFTLKQADNVMDVQALQMTHKQLSVLGALADTEEYMIPMYLEGELTNVHLRMERGRENGSRVNITLSLPQEEQVEAQFTLEGEKIKGILSGNTQNAVTKLKEIADIFSDSLQGTDHNWKLEELPVVQIGARPRMMGGTGSREMFYGKTTDGVMNADSTQKADNRELYQLAKLFLRAVKQQEKR